MEDTTINDVAREAQRIVEPFAQTHTSRLKSLLNNVATIISLLIIVLTMLLFAYNQGYSSVYHLPAKVIPIDIKMYLSLAVNIAMLSTYIFYYIACKNSDRLLGKKRINFLAVFYGTIIILTLLNKYNLGRFIGPITCIVIAVIVPIMVELIPRFLKKNCSDKVVDSSAKELKKEEFVWNQILYLLFVKNGIFVLAVCACLAPLVGEISAKANPNYQTCNYNSESYAVIVEYEDRVLVQRADIYDSQITIYTNSYLFLPKDLLEISYSTYDLVLIQEDIK